MKTPNEIKKGLECCSNKNTRCRKGCPYVDDGSLDSLIPDSLAYIQQLEEREWELFDLLSSAWHGKSYYFKQDNGLVYSRESCKDMTFGEALDEFAQTLFRTNDMP